MKNLIRLICLFISFNLFAQPGIASPYKYVNDNSTANDVFTTAVGNNANNGSQSAPYATLSYAISQAAEGDIIYVDAGSYAEQVIINKGITIIGAGQFLTFFSPPATTLIPAPGPFTEIGLFETTQGIGDVHISNLTINSNNASQNIIIQGGGSVTNCILANGFQGIFFRVESGAKTALIENNSIQPVGIGINCQGSGLTALIRNNRIIGPPNSYYAGIFAGLDFGPLPQLTIQNNIIENYSGEGILAASFNGTYTLNSIIGTGTNAINRNGNGGNTPIATCNWFGTSNAATVASKIIGTVIYTPFLTDGTDNSSNVGFQPNAGACATGTLYYVNDGINTGDIFTTAPGNDGNAGTPSAPFATLQHAVNTAAANDIIYVDAGTYTEQVTITKGINIIGAGQNVTSILKPAITVAPPGPFTEQGVIQTAQNIGDVNIKDLSVTGDFTVNVTPIIIQSGGSVRNCKLQSGNQGLFVRIDAATNPGAKTFYIEGNTIQAEYIAVNTVGTSLHAILSNNTIAAFNAGFSSGMWAGMDFGPLGRLTATNNLFSTYSSSGIQISASNASITQNAFTGTGAQAINRTGGANITANCNWYGVANAAAIVPKITAGVNYYPWYVDGTDANPVAGFQHYSESCGGGLNILYVNDNNTTGDLFTTIVGNDANAGTPTSPLATFGAALTRATPGTVIYMDAGTYTAQDATIDKQVQVIGTNFNASPNSAADPLLLNSNRNAETIIENTNWIIGANSLYFDGLTFNPLGKQAITLNSTTWSDTRLLRNRFRISSGLTQLNFTGSGTPTMAPSAIANWGLNIRENRFEKADAAFGTTLVVSRYGGVNINDNSFVVTGTAARTQTAISAGSSGVVNYLYVGNNTFDRAPNGIAISRLAIANINFNKFINTNTAFNGSNALPESSEVAFRYNILDGSGGIFPLIQYNHSGGNAVGASSSFTAEENTITGTAVAGTTTLLGSMNLIFSNSVLNPSLVVRSNRITIGGDLSTVPSHFIRPIMLRGNLVNAVVEKNEINLTGINQQPKTAGVDLPVSPAITLWTDNTTTSFLQSGSVINILNNKINGFKHSFAAHDPVNGRDTYIGYGNIPAGVTVNINNNSFTGDSISINNGTQSQSVNASCNWYGSAAAQDFINKITLPTVDVEPWLTNGTDADPASTGFQPLPDVCNGTPVVATLVSQTNISCFGGNNGSADVGISGGVLPYTTTWSREGDAGFSQNGEDLLNALAGNYTLLVTDAVGATATVQVSLQEPLQLVGLVSGTNVTCFGAADGTATIEVNGGVLPYTYLWSNGAETATISSLSPGTYSVTATDANGCTVGGSYTVIQPAAVNPAISVTNISCAGAANGQIALTGRAGVAPYMFSLNGIAYQESNVFANLTAGNYTGYVMDANGCVGTVSATISEPLPLEVVLTSVTGTCTGTSNGAIDVTVSGGTTRYGFAWTGPNNFTSTREDLTKVVAGTYTLVVTDANGCIANLMVVVGETPALVITGNVIPLSCFGTLTGAIDVSVTGGSGSGYTYVWSGPNGYKASTEDVSGLRAGSYTLTVTDAGGCSGSQVYTVTQPAIALSVTATKDDIIACDALGSITAIAAGGTAPYQYSLNGGALQSGNIFPNLPVGSYSIQATDAKGCTTALLSVSIADNGADAYETNNTVTDAVNNNIIINVGNTIRARLAAAKGTDVDWYRFTTTATGSYSVSWNHPSVSQTFDLYVLNKNKAVPIPATSVEGNTKSYDNLSPNTYLVQVSGTQSFICYDLVVNSLSAPPLITSAPAIGNQVKTIISEDHPLSATAFPNPHRGSFTLRIESPVSGEGHVTLYDLTGRALTERKLLLQKGGNTVRFEGQRPVGMVYRVMVDGKVVTGKVIGMN